MNKFVPNWSSNMGDTFAPLCGEDDGLMELLWCNGPVVLQNQAPRKPPARSDKEAAAAAQESEAAAAAWLQYPAVEDPLERDLFSQLFGEAPAAGDTGRAACKEEEERAASAAAATAPRSRLMPPPMEKACLDDVGVVSDCEAGKADGGGDGAAAAATEACESSMLTIGSSFCGSNHVQTARTRARDAATVTSSSMQQPRSSCAGKAGPPAAAAHRSGKRKQRDAAETEDAEFESAAVTCEPAQKLTTAKRRRAAEVHNLSERRRRDRINEKMKALQELIPYCNKTDKASMLDEAIEYLKSLQLQLQVMWMGGGMAAAAAATATPVMFPAGVHQYMQQMMAPPQVASMPRMPFMAAAPPAQSSPVGHVAVADPYARCLAVDRLQTPSPMGMSFFQQQSPAPTPPPQAVVPGGDCSDASF
ncbi:hypothetical protein EJB05_00427 [Eragrostis curvula]|uniref:BHLH domain-containing protein n=1 Tax=Eragrostis curvula TaxID=38414 RepID=A0A5J9WM03_9POAL|nr:hypothetical protein EJB05_00427 [Eragrostis curvula]